MTNFAMVHSSSVNIGFRKDGKTSSLGEDFLASDPSKCCVDPLGPLMSLTVYVPCKWKTHVLDSSTDFRI